MKIPRNILNQAYTRMQTDMCKEFDSQDAELLKTTQEQRHRFIYSFVMCLVTEDNNTPKDYDTIMFDFKAYETAVLMLGTLTPVELERMFPITKEYDGERWEMKDYFSCKKELNLLPQDEPVMQNKDMFSFLWDYHNNIIRVFLVNYTSVIDNIRRIEGQPSMMEEFLSAQGVDSYRKVVGVKGKEFLINNRTGEVVKTTKQPQHLRIVK